MQTGKSLSAALCHCSLSVPSRLANLVRGNVHAGRVSMDHPVCLEATSQRQRHTKLDRAKSISRRAAALRPRNSLPLRIYAARGTDKGVVEAHADWGVAAAVFC